VEKWRYQTILTIYRANAGLTVDGNIVKIKHDVASEGNKTVLGLFVEGTDATDYQLSANDIKLRFPTI
jgi:hypothetical protein